MSAAPELKKKTEIDQLAEIINGILDAAAKSRKGFTPEGVAQFYQEGQSARNQMGATPTKQVRAMVARKSEPIMADARKKAVSGELETSINLAEKFELAARGKKLNAREWTVVG